MKRRELFKNIGAIFISPYIAPFCSNILDTFLLASDSSLSNVEARYYKKLPDMEVECELCPRKCLVGDTERGYCGVRENRKGKYITLVYGKPCSMAVDPIEKKPFFHFFPGTSAFSLATAGCNVNCKFCQNWEISQVRPEQVRSLDLLPSRVASLALQYGCSSISYTYSEPVIFFEYMYDCSIEARKVGIKNTVVTNAYIQLKPLEELCKVVDAIKVDLKAFRESFYKDIVRGQLKPVLESIKKIKERGVWLEIVYLVIPGFNDFGEDIKKMAKWFREEVSDLVPVHFSRFHPMYLMRNIPPTPVKTLENLRRIAMDEGLKYVYIGNVPGHDGENTYCHNCGKLLIRRYGFSILEFNIKRGKCKFCNTKIPGIF
ncbi:MAG: AmmeMemoRadiSam system radical SAM enzyme [Candidatus Aminicenantia bacterium]